MNTLAWNLLDPTNYLFIRQIRVPSQKFKYRFFAELQNVLICAIVITRGYHSYTLHREQVTLHEVHLTHH